MNPPAVQEDLLYERFRRMKAPEFEGLADPIAADNWLLDIQVILEFMRLSEQEKVLCASFALKKDARHWWTTVQMRRNVMIMDWQDFVAEFRTMYYNQEVLANQHDEFTNLQQGSMTVMEVVQRFDQLARLCLELVRTETERVRRLMRIFRTDIAVQVSAGSSPPRTVSDCVSRALRAEYWINRDKEARAQIFKARREEKAAAKQGQTRQGSRQFPRGKLTNLLKVLNLLGRIRKERTLLGKVSRRISHRRGITKETEVEVTNVLLVLDAERSISECADWGQMSAISAEKKDIMPGIVRRVIKIKTRNTRTATTLS